MFRWPWFMGSVMLIVLSGCVVHIGYNPRLVTAQPNYPEADHNPFTVSIENTVSSATPAQSTSPKVPTAPKIIYTCVVPPKEPKPPIPKPLILADPNVATEEQILEALAEHVVLLNDFILTERQREYEYHQVLTEKCNP